MNIIFSEKLNRNLQNKSAVLLTKVKQKPLLGTVLLAPYVTNFFSLSFFMLNFVIENFCESMLHGVSLSVCKICQ